MSRIQAVINYQQPNMKQSQKNYAQNESFGAKVAYKDLSEGAKKIVGQCEPRMGGFKQKLNDFSVFLNDTSGEVQNNLINAAFTTSLAPIFIAFNPFAHEDKKTKEYTALRQPISAAIALGCALPITKMFNDYLGREASNGSYKSYDLRISQEKSFLQGRFDKTAKKLKGQALKDYLDSFNPEFSQFKSKYKADGITPTKSYYWACRSAFVDKEHEDSKKIFTQLISEKPENLKIENGVISLKNGKEIAKNIPNLTTQAQLDEYLNENNLHKVKLSDFLKKEFHFEFYEDNTFKPFTLNKKLSEVKAVDFLEELGFAERTKLDASELRRALLSVRQEKTGNKESLKRAIGGGDPLKTYETIGKDTSRNIEMSLGEKAGKANSISLGQFFHQLGYKANNGQLQELANRNISDVLSEFAKTFKGKIAGIDEKTIITDFGKKIMNNKASKVSKHFDIFKKYAGLTLNIPVTILSCTLLNWAYPRVVERLFPSLVKDDAPKGGNK